jgi:hypothetical protein
MRLAALTLILAGLLLAAIEFCLPFGRLLPVDSFTGAAVITYDLAALMVLGGIGTLLFSDGRNPVEDEPESQLLHLVG